MDLKDTIIKQLAAPVKRKGTQDYTVVAVRPDDCIGCAFCATMCPDCIIKVEKGE